MAQIQTLKTFFVGDFEYLLRLDVGAVVELRAIDDNELILEFCPSTEIRSIDGKVGNLDKEAGHYALYEGSLRTRTVIFQSNQLDAQVDVAKRYIAKHLPVVESEGGLTD